MTELCHTFDQIIQWMRALPDTPVHSLPDIEVHDVDIQLPAVAKRKQLKRSYTARPSLIVGDWLYLGSHAHCKSESILRELGITHILCCSDVIPSYFLRHDELKIKYARIPLRDLNCSAVFNYFAATTQFIDQCNPLLNNNNSSTSKILVHCEMGRSRSASFVIAYLLAKRVRLNPAQQMRCDFISAELFKHNDKQNHISVATQQAVRMKLSCAYYYVKSCRRYIEPNQSFVRQLQKWERICFELRWQDTTLFDTPQYTKSKHIRKLDHMASQIDMAAHQQKLNTCIIL